MTATEAINTLSELIKSLDTLLASIKNQSESIHQQWESLRNLAGERDDHAAALLHGITPSLAPLGEFATTCATQIDNF